MKREVIIGVLLIIVMAPALAQAAAPAQENNILPLADLDIWVDQLSVYYYNWTQLDQGDVIYVDFEVTSGSDITFFICDAENYDLWINEQNATAYEVQNSVGSYSTSFSVPSDGEWRIVFINYSSIVRKHIEGTVEIRDPLSPANLAVGFQLLGILSVLILGIAVAFHPMRKRAKMRKDMLEYGQPPSQQTDTSAWIRTSYCSTCGQSHHLPNARVCSNCGAFLGPPSDIS